MCFFTGLNAVNPFNGEKISVVFTNYVIMGFGTGAVFGCPAHDKRDFDFAQKFKFKISKVIESPSKVNQTSHILTLKMKPKWLILVS